MGLPLDMDERQICVQRAICASPGTIFEVLASPAGHVSIDASGMLMWADGDPVSAVGDRFTVQMDRDSLQAPWSPGLTTGPRFTQIGRRPSTPSFR